MERLSTRAFAYAGFLVSLFAMCLAGVALVGYGAQIGLADALGASLAAIVVGIAFIAIPLVIFAAAAAKARRPEPESEKRTDIPVNIAAVAKTAFLGLAATRPLTALGLAAAAGIARSSIERKI